MALVGLLSDENSLATYFCDIEKLHSWCNKSYLELNVKKTKELIFHQPESVIFEPVKISGDNVETVDSFKYLGTIIDTKLSFDDNADHIYKKCQQRLYFLRKLKSFNVCQNVLENVYRSLIESILSFNIVCWFGILKVIERNKLNRIVNLANKIIGQKQLTLKELYVKSMNRKAKCVVKDESHPLFHEFQLLPSKRRYRVPLSKKCYKKSFVPNAISILNSTKL